MPSRGKRPVSGQLRTLRVDKIEGPAVLLRDLGHLLAVLYMVCIGITIWVMSDEGFLLPRITGLASLLVGQ